MNQHQYYDPSRTYPAGHARPTAGPDYACRHYWPLETPNEADMMNKPGDPLVAVTLNEGGVSGYWSPEPHPRLVRFHQDAQQDTLF